MSASPRPDHDNDPEFSLFLLLCEEHRAVIDTISSECRAIIPSPIFVPHMTVYFGSGTTSHGLDALVEGMGANMPPLRQRILTVEGEDRFWRSLYVALETSVGLDMLDGRLREEITPYGNYTLFPHVSLIYSATATNEQREQCSARAKAILREANLSELLFTRIAAFKRDTSVRDWEDVARWQEVSSRLLLGHKTERNKQQ